tara:strand:- start:356 stop:862 length:507 start_codon:yes stop_codon:yes gene_type:complete
MLGYNAQMTSEERLKHHEALKKKFNNKIDVELEYAYCWVSNGDFLDTLNHQAPNQVDYCKQSMENPPLQLLNKMSKETKMSAITLTKKKCETEVQQNPTCYVCGKMLATSIVQIIDFSLLKCLCGQQYAHIKCADEYISKSSQCGICKKYILLNNIKHSNLQQTLLRF